MNLSITQVFAPSHTVIGGTTFFIPFYGSVEEADAYFNIRLKSRIWPGTPRMEKIKVLVAATRIIDRLNFHGDKSVANQILQFPRGDSVTVFTIGTLGLLTPTLLTTTDLTVPADIRLACYEIAYMLLDGYDPDIEAENLGSLSQGYAGARTTYDRSFVPEWVLAGIPSLTVWNILKPYLRDPRSITFSRVS